MFISEAYCPEVIKIMSQERLHAAASAIAHEDLISIRNYADVYMQPDVMLPAAKFASMERAPPVLYAMLTAGARFRDVLMLMKGVGVDLSAPFDVEIFTRKGASRLHTNAVSFALTYLWTSMRSDREHERLETLLEVLGPYVRGIFGDVRAAAPPLMIRCHPTDGLDALTVTLLHWAGSDPPRRKSHSTRLYQRLRLLWEHGARVISPFVPEAPVAAVAEGDISPLESQEGARALLESCVKTPL